MTRPLVIVLRSGRNCALFFDESWIYFQCLFSMVYVIATICSVLRQNTSFSSQLLCNSAGSYIITPTNPT